MKTVDIVKLYKERDYLNKEVKIGGWVLSNRDSSKIGFISVTDGTCFQPAQIVYKSTIVGFEEIKKIKTGYGLVIEGKVLETPNAKQPFEIVASKITVASVADEDYPMQKKRHGVEFLREVAHLRSRTNLFRAVFAVRNKAADAINRFFQEQNFKLVHTPIITTNDGEGAGESFVVGQGEKNIEDFFGRKTLLGVTGQLHGEAFAQAFKKIYTFGPTFRAEHSNTNRHAAEFWMIEPEVAFNDLQDNMQLMEDTIKYVVNFVAKECKTELQFLNDFVEKELLATLKIVSEKPFTKISYTEAIEILKEAVVKHNKPLFEENKIEWGMDLGSEHEKYICEKHFKGPVFLYNYPKDIKAFYMTQNPDGKTVAACDLLVPGIGELIGGSQREADYNKLKARCVELSIPVNDLEWYIELRRFGGVMSSGFGIGFERLVMYLTGVKNIKDVIPFPRAYRYCKY